MVQNSWGMGKQRSMLITYPCRVMSWQLYSFAVVLKHQICPEDFGWEIKRNKIWKFLRFLFLSESHFGDYDKNKPFPKPPSERAHLTAWRAEGILSSDLPCNFAISLFASVSADAGQQCRRQLASSTCAATVGTCCFFLEDVVNQDFPILPWTPFSCAKEQPWPPSQTSVTSNGTRNFQ